MHGPKFWWEYFKRLFCQVYPTKRGKLVLGFGYHCLTIPIEKCVDPINVYINCIDNGCSVCIGDVSMATAILNCDNTFTIIANVKSNSCTIKWLVEYDPVLDER